MKLRFVAVALFVLAGAAVHAKPFRLNPAKPMTNYVLASWSDTSGLPVDSVGCIAQTPDGYLWAGTEHGLVRFDGVRFTVFNTANTPVLKTNEIFTLFVSRDGTLWVGTRGGGALMYDGTRFLRVPIPYRYIAGFAQSEDGALWIGAPGGIARLHNGKFTRFEKEQGYPGGRLETIAADRNGVYVAVPEGVLRLDDKGSRLWTSREGLRAPARALLWTSQGLLAGTVNGQVDRLEGDRFVPVLQTKPEHVITSIYEGASGSLWLSSIGGGLLRFANGKVDALTTRDGLASDSLNQLFEDLEGNLWAALTGGGLVRIAEGSITPVLPPSVSAEWILASMRTRDGVLWFTTSGGGLYRMKGESVTRFSSADGLRGTAVTSLAQDRDGVLWIGSDAGLQRFERDRIVANAIPGLGGTFVHAITPSRQGGLWVSTEAGLHRVERGRAELVKGMREGTIIAIREAADGSLWLAKPRAVERFADGKLTCFSVQEGLRSRTITSITLDERDGSVWVPTMGDGLSHIRNGRVRTYRSANGLPSDSVYVVVQDRAGDLWISAGNGLFTIRRADLDAFDAGRATTIKTRVFRRPDGLKSNDFSGGFDRAGWRDPDGTLWFPTTRGLAMLDPEDVHLDLTPPRLRIESITANGSRHTSGPIDLPASQRHIDIAYTAPSFHAPEAMTFRYKLENLDNEWQDAGTRRTAYYTNIPPGTYRFIVEARTREGATAETSTTLTIKPQFHETHLFKVAIALFLILLALIAHRQRVANIRRHEAELRRSEEHFRSLIENAPDMILVIAQDQTITYASPSVLRILGRAPESMQGRPLEELLVDAAAGETFLADVQRSGRHAVSLSFRDATGVEREIESVGAMSREGNAEIVMNCRDITDRRRLESQLAQANRLSSLGRLAATVSHEFNNVLMGVQPFIDIIRRRTHDPQIQQCVVQMRRSVERGRRISEQILRYTRPADPTLRSVNVREWLLELEIEIRALVGPNIRVAVVAPPSLAVEADVEQLEQVLANLAINARDAGATRIGFEARIGTGDGVYPFGIVRDPGTFIHFTIRDDGSGIPESVLPHIFEPLFTTKTTKGTGLGLAVAQQVVARHGGELFVESRPGAGTAFHIFLKRAECETAVEEETAAVVSSASPERCRVLLVEDDSTIADGILTMLETENFDTDLATSGGDALHHIAKRMPDVVVLDVGLPDISGVEVFRRISAQWPGLPVIFSTGHLDIDAVQTMPAPHPPYLMKPYDLDSLLTAIAAVREVAMVTQSYRASTNHSADGSA
jgi:PAS domain S-box-containing protein